MKNRIYQLLSDLDDVQTLLDAAKEAGEITPDQFNNYSLRVGEVYAYIFLDQNIRLAEGYGD